MASSISFRRVRISVWGVFEKNAICNETIFHLIMKSTLAKLCGVGIVYLIFLLTEMKLSYKH
jgi:hypothetical protein